MKIALPVIRKLKFIIATAILLQIISLKAYSQTDSMNYSDFESGGSILNIYSNTFTNNIYYVDYTKDNIELYYDVNTDFSIWKFNKKILAGAYLNSNARYQYRNQMYYNLSYYDKNRGLSGELFTGLGYYPFKNKFYTTLSIGSFFYVQSFENSNNTGLDNYNSSGSTEFIYPGIGYGRIINKERISVESNFENVLKQERYISAQLPPEVKKKLTELLEKRNDKDFISKYRDNDEVEFFDQVEKLLLKEKVIESTLNAKTTMMLYQALTNPEFVYYPRFEGYQLQAELQYEANKNYSFYKDQNFITLGGIFGKLVNLNSQFLFSGYLTFPLNTNASSYGLFNFNINPFNNYLPVLFQRFQLQKNNYLDPTNFVFNNNSNLNYLFGGKIIFFKSFSSYIGIRPFTEFNFNKPINLTGNINTTTGMGIDYNIFTRLSFNLLAELNINNKNKPRCFYSLGFFLNVL